MAFKKLGAADLGATTDTDIYTVPTGKSTEADISICNRTAADINIRLAFIDPLGSVGAKDYILYDYVLSGNTTVMVVDIDMDASSILMARASATGVSVVCWGDET